jgi:hypothetical protein
MFPSQSPYEETLTPKEFAFLLDGHVGKNGLPKKYHTAIRLLKKHGGYVVTNDNPNYEVRSISRRKADEIIKKLTKPPKPPKNGGRQ